MGLGVRELFDNNIKVHFAGSDGGEIFYAALLAAQTKYRLFSCYKYILKRRPDDDFRLPADHVIRVQDTLTETGKIKVNGSRDGVIRARRKLKLFHREWLAGKRTLQEVAQYMNCQEAYYKNFDDHGRLLRLRRLCYAIFGGRVPCSTKSSKPVMAPSLP